jgi:hypothetical protein
MATHSRPTRSIHGRDLQMGDNNQLMSNEKDITSNAVDAVITIAASPTSPRTVSIQFNNADGTPIAHAQPFRMVVYLDALRAAIAVTGGSTGIAADAANGYLLATPVAKKVFDAITSAAGLWTGTWTDTAHEVAFLGVQMPSGRTVMSAALTTA